MNDKIKEYNFKIIFVLVWTVIVFIIMIIADYIALPAYNIKSLGLWFFLIIAVSLFLLGINWFIGVITLLICLFLCIILIMVSSENFNIEKYGNLTLLEEGNLEEDIKMIEDLQNISIVDVDTARNLDEDILDSIENSSSYSINDEYNLIKYKGKLYRIATLIDNNEIENFVKGNGIPGYVLINALTQETKFIELKEPIKYSPSACFSNNLRRHLRKKYQKYIFGKSIFEIDDEGNPYYITSIKNPTIGLFGGEKIEYFIITNACTGECKEYAVNELPDWVDNAFDIEYLMELAEYNLIYKDESSDSKENKTLNTSFSSSSKNYNTLINKDGDIVFYTGLVDKNNDQNSAGFILANPRTGVIKKYNYSGLKETKVMKLAENIVQDLNYDSTYPTILNINGEKTYFMLLKDNNKVTQRYSICTMKDASKFVHASTLEETINLYLGEKVDLNEEKNEEIKITKGNISEIYQVQIKGLTYYYLKLEGSDKLYKSSILNNSKQVLLKVGDIVSIEYISSNEKDVFIVKKIEF